MASKNTAPKAPEGSVAYEKEVEGGDTLYRFAYTPVDRVQAEYDGFRPVSDSAVEKQVKTEEKDAGAAGGSDAKVVKDTRP